MPTDNDHFPLVERDAASWLPSRALVITLAVLVAALVAALIVSLIIWHTPAMDPVPVPTSPQA